MNRNGSRKTNTDGKRGKPLYTLFVVSIIAAFVFASLPLSSALAAPVGPGGNNDDIEGWDSKVRNLQAEMSVLNNMQTQPGIVCASAAQARYRDQYIATMRAAQALLVNPGAFVNNNGNSSGTGNANGGNVTLLNGNGSGSYYADHPEKLMAAYLHRMRQLREKIASGSDNNGNSGVNNGGNNSQNLCLNNNSGTETGTGTGTGTGTTTPTPTP
jgi:hypothetical protein